MDTATAFDICRCILDGPAVGAAQYGRMAQLLDEAEVPDVADDEHDLIFQREALSDCFVALSELYRLGAARGKMPEADRRRRIATYGYVYEGTLNALLEQARLYGGPWGRAWYEQACLELFKSLPRAERSWILKGMREQYNMRHQHE